MITQMAMIELNYRKITERIADNLTLAQIYGFYVLAMKSDYNTNESHINQTTLAQLLNVDRTTIIRWLKVYEENNLLSVEHTHIINEDRQLVKKNIYRLNTENYKLIGDGLLNMNVSNEIKGFLILIKCRCYNCTNLCEYSSRELAKTCKITQSTIVRYINKCITLGLIKRDKQGITLVNENIFIPQKESTYYWVLKTYPQILTDKDIEFHTIFNNDKEYEEYIRRMEANK